MSVIPITFSTDLPSRAHNQLRYRMELKEWKDQWAEAEKRDDFEAIDDLQREYEMVGMS